MQARKAAQLAGRIARSSGEVRQELRLLGELLSERRCYLQARGGAFSMVKPSIFIDFPSIFIDFCMAFLIRSSFFLGLGLRSELDRQLQDVATRRISSIPASCSSSSCSTSC